MSDDLAGVAMTAKGWAVVGPDGDILITSCALTEDDAWTNCSAWRGALVAAGYRCVRVTVTVEDEG
jgi:hypothetical protein